MKLNEPSLETVRPGTGLLPGVRPGAAVDDTIYPGVPVPPEIKEWGAKKRVDLIVGQMRGLMGQFQAVADEYDARVRDLEKRLETEKQSHRATLARLRELMGYEVGE